LRGSAFNGFASTGGELFWSTGEIEIPNHKSQISNKSQLPKFQVPNLFFVLVIEYWNLIFVCNLVLGI